MFTLYNTKRVAILFLFLSFAGTVASQFIQKAIGAESFEKGSAIKLLPDGGYIIAGETESFGLTERDMLLTRTDSLGNLLWSKTFGGPERETVNDVMPMPDGGFLLTSEKYQPNKQEGENLTLIKTDANGNIQWKKIYDEGGNETEGFAMHATPDKAYIIAGMTKSMTMVSDAFFSMRSENQFAYLLKVDSKGNKLWSKKFEYGGANVSSTATSVAIAADGSYLVAGNIGKKGKTDKKIEKPAQQVNMEEIRTALLLKVKPNGQLLWSREIEANKITMGFSVIETKNGGIVLAGNTNVSSNNMDVFITTFDNKGNLLWSKTYGAAKFESVADVVETPDGGLVVSAMTYSFGNNISDVLLFKTDASGNLQWAKTYGGHNEEYPSKLILANNKLVTVGSTASNGSESFDVLLMSTGLNGTGLCWGNEVKLATANFQPVVTSIATAKMEIVEQGILPPNMKKPDAANIVEQRRIFKNKELCK
ncbi:MAG: PQQ-binding-like beta-propeller repeat protein [Chitinophagales bacterium]|nr:PQQ-binding-like beta-propeller repeat protein [Chitinophagales bacterium]